MKDWVKGPPTEPGDYWLLVDGNDDPTLGILSADGFILIPGFELPRRIDSVRAHMPIQKPGVPHA